MRRKVLSNANDTFIANAKAAQRKAEDEHKRALEAGGQLSTKAHQVSMQEIHVLSAFMDAAIPDLDATTIKSIREQYPTFADNKYGKTVLEEAEAWVLFNPWRFVNGTADLTRREIVKQRLEHLRSRYWRWLMAQIELDECCVPALKAVHAQVCSLKCEERILSSRSQAALAIASRASLKSDDFRRIGGIYRQPDSVSPTQDLISAVELAAQAKTGGIDEYGDPVVDENLLPAIRFASFAYIESTTKKAIAA